MLLSGCSLPVLKPADLAQNTTGIDIKEHQIQSASYCTMGFIDPEIKLYKYYDDKEKRFKYYDSYILKKCILVRTTDKLIILPRKGSEIGSPEIITISKDALKGIGLFKKRKYRQMHLKTQDKLIVIELLKSTVLFVDTDTADELFEHLRKTGVSVFDVKQQAMHVLPTVPFFGR